MSAPPRPIEEVFVSCREMLMNTPGVIGTGIGLYDDTPCIRVFLAEDDPETRGGLPETIEGYRVDVIKTGEIRAL